MKVRGNHKGASLSRAGSGLSALFVLLPVGQNGGNARRVGETVNILKVLLGNLEGTGSHVGDVLANQLAGVNGGLVDLLQQEGSERLDTGAQEGTVEWHINTLERDRGETTLQLDRTRLGFGLLDTFLDDTGQMSLDILERHALHQSRDVDVLCLEEVEQVGEAVESAEL